LPSRNLVFSREKAGNKEIGDILKNTVCHNITVLNEKENI
jgi:hypothetical protein